MYRREDEKKERDIAYFHAIFTGQLRDIYSRLIVTQIIEELSMTHGVLQCIISSKLSLA
jgi:hypothetical protein